MAEIRNALAYDVVPAVGIGLVILIDILMETKGAEPGRLVIRGSAHPTKSCGPFDDRIPSGYLLLDDRGA